jgi:predicted nucleic acid binding AN1-type Zn finger protein
MKDDFSNLRNLKDQPFTNTEDLTDRKQTTTPKPIDKMRFIITNNKNNSWIDDLHAQAQLNQVKRIYH